MHRHPLRLVDDGKIAILVHNVDGDIFGLYTVFHRFGDLYRHTVATLDFRASFLYRMPNVMMMPHMAGPTVDMRSFFTRELLLEASGFIDRGEPLTHEITRTMAATMSNK